MSDNIYKNYIKRLGIPDKIIEHGSQDQLYTECGYDKKAIIETCMKITDKTMLEELSRLPEIKCICGFRVFTKERSGLVKTVKAI